MGFFSAVRDFFSRDFSRDRTAFGDESEVYTAKYRLSGQTDGEADAFGHAYSGARATQEYGSVLSAIFGVANEVHEHKGSVAAMNMDLYNNKLGRSVGVRTTTNDETAREVMELLNSGALVVSTSPTDKQYRYTGDISKMKLLDRYVKDVLDGGAFNDMRPIGTIVRSDRDLPTVQFLSKDAYGEKGSVGGKLYLTIAEPINRRSKQVTDRTRSSAAASGTLSVAAAATIFLWAVRVGTIWTGALGMT